MFGILLSGVIPLRLWRRHGATLVRYLSLGKLLNAVHAIGCYAFGSTIVPTKPLFLKVEMSRYCTVHCLGCTFPKEFRFYDLDKYKALVDELAPHLFMIQLHEIGEPLHCPHLLESIKYAHARGVGTVISSSLSLRKPDSYWRDLVESGLDRLVVAIDGTTDSVYNRYRTEGDLPLVMENLEKILGQKKRRKGRLFVEWQMVDLPWNRAEQEIARRLATDLGCDDFQIIPDASTLRQTQKATDGLRDKRCLWPYVLLLVNVYDDVIPCFKPGCQPGVLGNLSEASFGDVWNGSEIGRIRSNALISSRSGCCHCAE